MDALDGHSREDYEACIQFARDQEYWGMLAAIIEDGYDPSINWRELMKGRS